MRPHVNGKSGDWGGDIVGKIGQVCRAERHAKSWCIQQDIDQATSWQRHVLGIGYGSAVLSRGKVSSRGITKTTIAFPGIGNRGGWSMVAVLSVASPGYSRGANVGLSSVDVGGDDVQETR